MGRKEANFPIANFCKIFYKRMLNDLVTFSTPQRKYLKKKRYSFIRYVEIELQVTISSTLMKLITGVNFTNILQVAFTCPDPKSAKNTVKLSVYFCTFGICVQKSWS